MAFGTLDHRCGDLSENLGGPGKCWHLGLRSRWRQAPPCETAGRAGGRCGRGSPSPAKGVRGVTSGKFFKLHMATDAF
jgi:hypothetical protein